MKRNFLNSVIFILLAFVISNLSGCGGTAQSTKSDDINKSSTYPLISEALSTSDLKNIDGTLFKMADRKGKVVLLNMWATWCGPCRSEMPSLVKMQDEHRDQGFEVIGINTDDESVDDINKFAAEMKLNYTLVWADMDFQTELLKISKFPGIPQSFIIDREGRLRAIFRGAGPADVKKMGEVVSGIMSE